METADVHRVADLRLRGPAGKTPVRVWWPAARPATVKPPIVLVLPDTAPGNAVDPCDDELARDLCAGAGAVVLCVPWAPRRPGALDRADAALRWIAEHGDELGGDPERLILVGRGAGAAGAAALGVRVGERGWPPLERQVLIVGSGEAGETRARCAPEAEVYELDDLSDLKAGRW